MEKYLLPLEEIKQPIEFANQQLRIFWLPDEIKIEKDIQDILVNLSEAEKHGVITTLKLFSLYETHAGDEYWGGRFKRIFKRPEFHRMASVFSMFELAIHAPFYNKINQLLHLDTPDFYLSYLENKILKERMEHIVSIINDPEDFVSIAMFSMIEGVVLYSSFAFLKHFQSLGKNKLMNLVRGINFSLRDENLHASAGAWCFKYLTGNREIDEEKIIEGAFILYEHEVEIIRMIFEKGEVEGISAGDLISFVESRINECLKNLGLALMFKPKKNPIGEWFYKAINDYSYNDFFTGVGNQYHRNWDETAFVWGG